MPLHCGDLNDAQWQKLYPLLPTKACTGRPAADHRAIINGMSVDSPHGCDRASICPLGMDRGVRYRAAFTVGALKASGRRS